MVFSLSVLLSASVPRDVTVGIWEGYSPTNVNTGNK